MKPKQICLKCNNLIVYDYLHYGYQSKNRIVKDCYACSLGIKILDYEIRKCNHFKDKHYFFKRIIKNE